MKLEWKLYIESMRPDGEIGRHSGLKIVKVYAFSASKHKINKWLFGEIDDLKADATLTHFSWYSWRVWR